MMTYMITQEVQLHVGMFLVLQPSGDPYAFIEFWEHHAAAAALAAMNKRSCFGKVSSNM